MAGLSLKNVTKNYQNGHVAVRDFTLDIADSEFVALVGPEGCGRSTVLRMIAGLEDISSGEFLMDGRRVNEENTREREVAMLFENCVLYPQMSVYENMAFGLRLKRLPEREIDKMVRAMADHLNLADMLDALPEQLTEAQRQLAAVGRALVRKPQVFLMDRPFSSRNAAIKEDMQNELIKLYQALKITSIYATGDPMEAMKMGTKVVVMNEGTIQQAGTPREICETPANRFVARFMGNPGANILEARISEEDGQIWVDLKTSRVRLPEKFSEQLRKGDYVGKEVSLGIRPEHVFLGNRDPKDPSNEVYTISGENCQLSEDGLLLTMTGEDGIFAIRLSEPVKEQLGDTVSCYMDKNRLLFFDKETGRIIL